MLFWPLFWGGQMVTSTPCTRLELPADSQVAPMDWELTSSDVPFSKFLSRAPSDLFEILVHFAGTDSIFNLRSLSRYICQQVDGSFDEDGLARLNSTALTKGVLLKLCADRIQAVRVPQALELRRRAAFDPASEPVLLTYLASDPDLTVRVGVAVNPNAPDEANTLLRQSNDPWFIGFLGIVSELSNPDLSILARHEDIEMRRVVALCDGLSESIVNQLLKDSEPFVRQTVAERLHTYDLNDSQKVDVRAELLEDPQFAVRNAIVSSESTPEAGLMVALKLKSGNERLDKYLRMSAFQNANFPGAQLHRVFNEDDPTLMEMAG